MRCRVFHVSVGWFGALIVLFGLSRAVAQSPLTLPYTITSIAGGGTVCSTAADTIGDGCPAPQATLGSYLLGLGVDARGNVYIADTINNMIRRIDASTGIITVLAGSASSGVCAAALDRYGDGCPASDGLANIGGGHTSLGKPYALAVARNGDVYISAGISLVQKISASTGLMTVVAGVTTPAGKAGSAVSGYTGDAGPATSAELNLPRGIALSPSEDLYIADYTNDIVRVVYNGGTAAASQITAANPAVTTPIIGNIYTIAGHPVTAGTTGDGGPASAALLTNPADVAVDGYGNLFIVDQSKEIRMVYAGGDVMGLSSPVVNNIYRVAGGGTVKGNTLNVILGTTATMSTVRRVIADSHGDLFVSDSNEIIWFVDGATGWMRPIAGVYKGSSLPTGCPQQTDSIGDGCPATVAQIHLSANGGYGIAVDANENLYIGDGTALTIRKVSPGLFFPSVVPASPVAQTAELHYGAGAVPATSDAFAFDNTDFSTSASSCTANGDSTSDCIVTTTFTPTVPGQDASPLHTADTLGHTGTIGYAGTGIVPALALDPGVAVQIAQGENKPSRLAYDGHGNLYIADTGNHRVLRYNVASQTQTAIAGTGTAGYSGDNGAAGSAMLNAPQDIALAADGTLYIADTGNNVIRRVDATTGVITTYAGGAMTVCAAATNTYGDGCSATQVILTSPSGLTVAPSGLLYVADTGNNRIRIVPLNQAAVQTVVGGATTVCSASTDTVGNGCPPLQVTLSAPQALRLDTAGNLYIADTGNNMVRRVSFAVSGQPVTTSAGNGQAGGSGDGGAATTAQLNAPASIALDGAGNVYIADTGNHAIRFVSATTGTISTVAGFNGASGTGMLPAVATDLLLTSPEGVECAGSNGLFLADTSNSRIVSIDRTTVAFNFGKVNVQESSPVQFVALTSTGSTAVALGRPLTTSAGDTAQLTLMASTTNGCTAGESLGSGAACSLSAQFTPVAVGEETAIYTFEGATANTPVPSVTLSGTGAILIATTTTLAQTAPTSGKPQYGQTTVFTATTTPASQGASPISGTVTFSIDGISQAPISLTIDGLGNGMAAITLPRLSVGTHMLVATYSGDEIYGKSTSTAYILTVTQSQSSVIVTASPTAIVQFQSVSFSATVSAATGGVPTGTVTFTANGTTIGLGSLSPTGPATVTTTTLAVGTYQVVANYSGDTNFTTSASSPLTFVVSPDPQDFTFTQSTTSLRVAQGGNVQTNFTITPTNTLNGNVQFACSGLPANSSCTFAPSVTMFSPASNQPQTITLTLWTNVSPSTIPTASMAAPAVFSATLLPFGLIAFCSRKRRCLRVIARAFTMLILIVSLSGCGQSQAVAVAITPAGTNTVTVTGTGPNGQVHTFTLNVTVTSAS